MRLIFNGNELDTNIEHELLYKGKGFGYNALIIYKDGSIDTRNNCHEVHHLYSNPFEPSIAFESDFHGTGGTCKVEKIDFVILTNAVEMAKEY